MKGCIACLVFWFIDLLIDSLINWLMVCLVGGVGCIHSLKSLRRLCRSVNFPFALTRPNILCAFLCHHHALSSAVALEFPSFLALDVVCGYHHVLAIGQCSQCMRQSPLLPFVYTCIPWLMRSRSHSRTYTHTLTHSYQYVHSYTHTGTYTHALIHTLLIICTCIR